MRPPVDQALRTLAGTLLTPSTDGADYAQASAEMIGVLLLFAAVEAERAADVRETENRAIRALFAEASRRMPDVALRKRLAEESRGTDASRLVTDLDVANDRLKRLLIELHEEVEQSPNLADLDRAVWKLYRLFAEGRALPPVPF